MIVRDLSLHTRSDRQTARMHTSIALWSIKGSAESNRACVAFSVFTHTIHISTVPAVPIS